MASQESNKDDLFHLKNLFAAADGAQEFQERLTDFFPAIVYIYDADKKKLRYINKQVTELLGYSYTDVDTWKDGVMDLVFKEDLEQVKLEVEKFYELSDDKSHLYECRLNGKQGDWRYFRTRGTVLKRGDNGKASSILFIAEDITDQFKSTEEIKQLKQLRKETEHLLGFGIYNYDLASGDMTWSDGLYQIFEYDKADEVPILNIQTFLSHVSPDDRDMLTTVMNRSIESKSTFNATYSIITHKGTRKQVSSRGKIVVDDDGQVVKLVASILDISTEIARQEELEEYKSLTDTSEELLDYGSWEKDERTGVYRWSDGMFRLFGYDPVRFAGVTTIDDQFYSKHMLKEDWEKGELFRQDVLSHKNDYTWEHNIVTADSLNKKLESFAKLVRDDEGEVVKVIGITRDITQIRSYEKNLEATVRELNRSNRDLEEFAYVASHDLQEPLRKLSTFSERLVAKVSGQLGDEGIRYTERIIAATENMRTLIENLLEFSRAARPHIPFERIDMAAVLRQTVSDLEITIEQTGAVVSFNNLPTIDAISSQMQQLFTNLIGNAIKFRKPNEVPRVDISSETLSVHQKDDLGLPLDAEYFRLEVRDNGIGFEQEYAHKIFQIFQRLHGKVEYPGSGVGLAICKKIVENHRGTIYAEGRVGEGSVFTIILPEKHL